jgi:heme/copper-type cytochrome/quinol oxidase subunit 2
MIMTILEALWYGLKFSIFIIGTTAVVVVAAIVLLVIWLERRERNRRGDR